MTQSIKKSQEVFTALHDCISQQPGDRVALVTKEGYLTYGELNGRANRLARRLGELGIEKSRPIAICPERSVEFVTAILGVLKAGHSYVPLDPKQPWERISALLEQARAGALVTTSDLFSETATIGIPALRLDRERKALAGQASHDLGISIASDDAAYCMFTSGSTGKPKCVEITHGGLAAYPGAFNSKLGLDAEGTYLHVASFSFSASLRQLFVPLSVGARVALASLDQIRDPLALLRWVKQEDITVIDWVPSYLRGICAELSRLPEAQRSNLLDHQVKVLVSSGEALSWSLVRRWRDEIGFRGRIANAYGQTETTGLVAWYEIQAEPPGPPVSLWVPMGSALPQAELYGLNGAMQCVPPGVVGDLWVAGPCVARGYLNQGNTLLKRPNPFSKWPDLYSTGDRVRVNAEGLFEFEGRVDDQVKVHGVRVALGEIEEALRCGPGVMDAAVVAAADAQSETRIYAFIVPHPGAVEDDQALRRFLREHFPDYVVPHFIQWCVQLPRTASGKADRPALMASISSVGGIGVGAEPSGTSEEIGAELVIDVEAVVREAWSHTLGSEAGDGDFFELGGDSLQAIALLGRITSNLQVEIPLIAAFFGDPTLQGLVKVIRDGMAAAPARARSEISKAPRISRPLTS